MSSELPILASHQPTWHTPTTEPSKGLPHSPLFNLQQMLGAERPFPRHSPGVDLSLTRNGSQNGDLPQTPISLSVRDAKQINSLPPSALDGTDRAVELTKVASPGIQESQPSPKGIRKPAKRVDSILERLNTTSAAEKSSQSVIVTAASSSHDENSNSSAGTGTGGSLPATTVTREDEVVSPTSNEDSLDSNKSRRKRKPSKTIKVSKDDEAVGSPEPQQTEDQVETQDNTRGSCAEAAQDPLAVEEPAKEIENEPPPPPEEKEIEKAPSPTPTPEPEETHSSPVRRRSSSEPPASPQPTNNTRRKTVSESETIDNIAAMVAATDVPVIAESVKEVEEVAEIPPELPSEDPKEEEDIPVIAPPSREVDHSTCSGDSMHSLSNDAAVIHISEESIEKVDIPVPPMLTAAQKKGDNQCFVAVEDELEKMFAGIADSDDKLDTPLTDPLALPSTSQTPQNTLESVTSTSNDIGSSGSKSSLKRGRPKGSTSKNNSLHLSESNSTESTPRKKHKANKNHEELDDSFGRKVMGKLKKGKKFQGKQQTSNKPDVIKDVYSYDSGSNASSSRSRGPFIQIRGPRDSPISVSIVNAPSNDDDPEKPGKPTKNKKFHDDSEYRHKVRSKGLHCSTLSNKYDAQTRDTSWICVFCKRGPHATDSVAPGSPAYSIDTPQYSPGDLFGPYVITADCPEYRRRLDDPYDTQFKSKRTAAVAASIVASELLKSGKKSKKRQNLEANRDSLEGAESYMLGIAEATSNSYEVWVHEDCVTWAPGVYLVGPKIVGLEGAVWGACSINCRRCGHRGATVCCLKRGCGSVMHIGCAKLSKWKLDEQLYKAYCTEHL